MVNRERKLILVAHNLRSAHNVGSLLRTCEGLGVHKVFLAGYTPYPQGADDTRLPHEALKVGKQIRKTALGAEDTLAWQRTESIDEVLQNLRADGYQIAALEQTPDSIALPDFTPPEKLALIVGREVEGVEPEILAQCDMAVEVPMFGQKESFNVVQATAMALYHCRFS